MTNLSADEMLAINRDGWDHAAPKFYGSTALPTYGPLAPTEDSLRLLDPFSGARVLELGCGSGHSLQYLGDRGAAELWGLDLSATQIAYAADLLQRFGPRLHLLHSPMEINPGLPAGYFDLVISIYGLGWTIDLQSTLGLAATYLKPGGCLIFSGEHPVYSCLSYEDDHFVFAHPYIAREPEPSPWSGGKLFVRNKATLSTFINEVVRAGLQIEQLIESDVNGAVLQGAQNDPARWYSVPRARLMPTTFIVKARKPSTNG